MGGVNQRAPGRLIRPVGFHSHQPVFHQVGAAYAVVTADLIKSLDQLDGTQALAIDRHRRARLEADAYRSFLLRRVLRTGGKFPRVLGRLAQMGFQRPALMAQVPQSLVAAVEIRLGGGYGDVVTLRVLQSVFARLDGPFTPGCDDPQLGRQRLVGQLESHLVIAFPRATVRQGVGALFEGNLHLGLGKQRPGQGSSQQVLALVNRARLDGFPKVAGYKLLAEVLDKNLGGATGQSLAADGGVIVALADVPHHGDNFAAVVFTQPRNDNGGIKPSRVCQYHALDFRWRRSRHGFEFRVPFLRCSAELFFRSAARALWVMKNRGPTKQVRATPAAGTSSGNQRPNFLANHFRLTRTGSGDKDGVIAGHGSDHLLPGVGVQRHGHRVGVSRPGLQDYQVRSLARVGQEFLQHNCQGRLGRRHRFRRLRQVVSGARLDQAELLDIARDGGLGHMDTPARQLAAKVLLRFDLFGPQEVHDLCPSIDLVHAILCKQLINIPRGGRARQGRRTPAILEGVRKYNSYRTGAETQSKGGARFQVPVEP